MPRLLLHLDMNSYFASVEQQANPFLRGKPLGVCAYLSENGCIIASSIEAKRFGIKAGCRVQDGRQRCPALVLVENEPAKYRSVTEQIFAILSQYTDRLEPYSIDEAFLDLTGWVSDYSQAEQLATTIRQRITTEVGDWLRCSIGISFTRWLAKFASDQALAGTTLIIRPEGVLGALEQAKLTDAWGINYRLAARLEQLGITTLTQLRVYPPDRLRRSLGLVGYYLWANVNGIELGGLPAEGTTAPKSIGHSYCLPRHTTDRVYLRPILMKLCERAGRRLRGQQLEAEAISVWASYIPTGGITASRRTAERLFSTESIFRYADHYLFAAPPAAPIRMLAISLSRLSPLSRQQALFTDHLRAQQLAMAVDTINSRYGEFTIHPGLMWGTDKNAADRVGYRKTVEVERGPELYCYAPENDCS